jgi:hypothetical protein
MQGKLTRDSLRWVTFMLVLSTCGVGFISYVAMPMSRGNSRLFGGFLIVIGALHLLFHKKSGQRWFARTQSIPPYFAKFWARGGERGMQILFLGWGIIFVAAGGVLMVLGSR